MNIKLHNLRIENFKGIKNFSFSPEFNDVIIKAENGIGKTTIYDAFLWLLFDKDSTGRKAFEVRPLDRNNQPYKGLVVSVIAQLEIDGVLHTFRKEQHEKVVKDQLRGYELSCWIDEVPKKVGEYQEYITKLIPEETFKLLTDLSYFNSKMHWTDRRKALLEIAGEISTPEGFEELLSVLNGRTVEQYKKVLVDQKKLHVKEGDEINPRIDELMKGLEHPLEANIEELTKERDEKKEQVEKLKVQRQDLYGKETERQSIQSQINNLNASKIGREAELLNDTSAIQALHDEKSELQKAVSEKIQAETEIAIKITGLKTELNKYKGEHEYNLKALEEERTQLDNAKTATIVSVCYACGQSLPKDKIDENEKKRAESINDLTQICSERSVTIQKCMKAVGEIEEKVRTATAELEAATKAKAEAIEHKNKRSEEIDTAIANRPTPKPEEDEKWQSIVKQIDELHSSLGKPVSEQLNAIEAQRITLQNEIDKLNETLAQADRFEKDKKRVNELKKNEKELAQKIADIEKQLDQIDEYNAAYSTKIEEAVNDRFEHVTFKMFKQNLNGSLEPTCEALLDGVPYMDMSTGQQILCGIDIINVLSEHYDISTPLFIDHCESLTIPIEAKSQVIKLFAVDGVNELQVEVIEKAVA